VVILADIIISILVPVTMDCLWVRFELFGRNLFQWQSCCSPKLGLLVHWWLTFKLVVVCQCGLVYSETLQDDWWFLLTEELLLAVFISKVSRSSTLFVRSPVFIVVHHLSFPHGFHLHLHLAMSYVFTGIGWLFQPAVAIDLNYIVTYCWLWLALCCDLSWHHTIKES
jgi:hypothetical protein